MTATTPDCELVSAYAAQGSEAAFQALVQRHVDLVFATAMRHTGNAAMAEDVTQQVFISLARKAPRLGGFQTLAGWLHRATVLETKTRIRAELRRQQREHTASEIAQIQSEGASPFAALLPLLDEALLNLRETDRLALVVRFLEERSLREVGDVLGVDEDAARKRVERALERVCEFFRRRGFTAVLGAGGAALLASATQAAPAGLASAAGKSAVAAGISKGGFNVLLYRIMALTKTQTAALCAVMVALPLFMQERANDVADQERAALASQIDAARQRQSALAAELQQTRADNARAEQGAVDARLQAASMAAQLSNAATLGKYRWDEHSPYARVPKKAVREMNLEAAENHRGKLSEQIKQALLMTPDEADETQAAMSQFLVNYETAEAKLTTETNASEGDLKGHSAEQTKAFNVPYVGSNEMTQMREDFFGQVTATLGEERADVFTNALEWWMPVKEDFNGIGGGMAVFNFPYHAVFYQPSPGATNMEYWITGPGKGLSGALSPSEISPMFQSYMQDWMAQMQNGGDGP